MPHHDRRTFMAYGSAVGLAGTLLVLGLLLKGAAPACAQEEGAPERAMPERAMPVVEQKALVVPDTLPRLAGVAQASLRVEQAPSGEGGKETASEAARAYRHLLRSAGPGLKKAQRASLMPHVLRLVPLLPERLRAEVWAESTRGGNPSAWRFSEGAGKKLLAWWRSRDPLPATKQNERLQEHLQRVAFARKHFSCEECPSGLDDRGTIYLRYGPPARITEIPLRPGDDPDMGWKTRRYSFSTLHVYYIDSQSGDPPELRPFELWTYQNINKRAYFLFVDRVGPGHRYTLRPLRDVTARPTAGAPGIVYESFAAMHSSFTYRGAFPTTSGLLARHRNWRARRRRDEATPQKHSSLLEDANRLKVAYRTARFLDADGTTRAEVYWAPKPGALNFGEKMQANLTQLGYPAPRHYLLNGHARAYNRSFRSDTARTSRRVVAPSKNVAAQTFALTGLTGLFHLGLQFEQRPLRLQGDSAAAGPVLRLATARVDTLAALPPAASGLAMSDLRPLLLPRRMAGKLVQGKALRKQTRQLAYPFEKLLPTAPLALYFEAYHLTFGADDHTRYTVEYEIQRRTNTGGLRGLFGGEEEQRTATRATYEGASRTAHEVILLDLSEVEAEEASELVITVRVTDEETGKTEGRQVDFEVVAP